MDVAPGLVEHLDLRIERIGVLNAVVAGVFLGVVVVLLAHRPEVNLGDLRKRGLRVFAFLQHVADQNIEPDLLLGGQLLPDGGLHRAARPGTPSRALATPLPSRRGLRCGALGDRGLAAAEV